MAPKKGRRNKHVDDDDEETESNAKSSLPTDTGDADKTAPPAKKTSKKKQVSTVVSDFQ